ncbi:MAG TPA: CBS domain-containing protein [Candidatus Altiarchaeales archaeon]|nr:CBS domain-containing protein [Candidatus Altiarchaeales archaeon]
MTEKVKVKDYMTREVDYLSYNLTVKEAIEILLKSKHQNFPVTRNSNLVGVITAKDLLRNYNTPDKPIKDITRRRLIVARPDLNLDDAARIMFRNGLKKLPVIDEKGRLIGIITNTDILRSHIERATPRKVDMVKNLLESEYGIRVTVKKYPIPIDKLHPTQDRIYADELEGREYELKKGLAEPLIVIKKRNYYVLVDGHHRAVAALNLGIDELAAHVLEMDRDVELGMEKSAREKNLITLRDIKIMDYTQHPLVEITTKLIRRRHLQ